MAGRILADDDDFALIDDIDATWESDWQDHLRGRCPCDECKAASEEEKRLIAEGRIPATEAA